MKDKNGLENFNAGIKKFDIDALVLQANRCIDDHKKQSIFNNWYNLFAKRGNKKSRFRNTKLQGFASLIMAKNIGHYPLQEEGDRYEWL